ncbi:MAG: response regulator [Spirochaetales bacterium]|nr:response regulator [Spirochaetales bacterium]
MDKKIILCVDDTENVLKSLERFLIIEGYTPVLANNGKEALDILSRQKVDMVIVDEKMPEIGGSELIKIMRKQFNITRILMLTGYIGHENPDVPVMQKPWNINELKKMINYILKRQTM